MEYALGCRQLWSRVWCRIPAKTNLVLSLRHNSYIAPQAATAAAAALYVTDRADVVHFSLIMQHLVAVILMIFLINWPNFVYLLVDPGFLSFPLKFLWSIAIRYPHRMDAPDRHSGQTNAHPNRDASVCPPSILLFVRLLDGVWHIAECCHAWIVYRSNGIYCTVKTFSGFQSAIGKRRKSR